MVRGVSILFTAAAVLALAGCGPRVPKDALVAAEDLFEAVVDRDRVAFEAAVDRPALRENLKGQIVELARANGLEVDGGPSEFALDRMIGPEAFRLVDERGLRFFEAPTPEQLAPMMRAAGKGHVCLFDEGRDDCLLTFARQKDKDGARWRLVAMPAQDLTVRLPAEGARSARRTEGRAPG
ncbi:DUF2939 domain-containing protein [Phenylobacterium sp. J367]|uniref:DUF2939 domain-containing protein n=1 Tax=Phenylobacterium sp. J367 TaxID=2898435 RepID=UPI0021508AE3|nr:DUF2939 domain-containing protein [Phenylobacterium sp. J367]MCR5878267.1 DUF2939 domain-containing protein [Phenylobacterium sp. J367]